MSHKESFTLILKKGTIYKVNEKERFLLQFRSLKPFFLKYRGSRNNLNL